MASTDATDQRGKWATAGGRSSRSRRSEESAAGRRRPTSRRTRCSRRPAGGRGKKESAARGKLGDGLADHLDLAILVRHLALEIDEVGAVFLALPGDLHLGSERLAGPGLLGEANLV